MVEDRVRGLLDTSVVIDLAAIDPARLPASMAVSAVTMAELSAGPHAARDERTRARRQAHLQSLEAAMAALPFDAACARAFGEVYAAVVAVGRKARGPRSLDLLIAATAAAYGLPLYTRNPKDFRHLEGIVEVVAV